MVRDLYDALERENDLKDQLQYTEEEARDLKRKIHELEDENEALLLRLKKVCLWFNL